ncbi:MAG: hypothetical protein AMJ46_09945 [Latescibacteria bacterium DG_63]|nr:MAG: hypothetical protein AMJ46_09945 [Latescibacteria bacterium DG_63]
MQALLLVLFCLLLAASESSLATTNCQQSFTFLGKSPGTGESAIGNPVFWVLEDISGECEATHLIQIAISERGPICVSSNVKKYKDWAWLKEGIGHLQTEAPIELEDHDGTWRCAGVSWTVRTQHSRESRDELNDEFAQHVNSVYERNEVYERNRLFGLAGVGQPMFGGITHKPPYSFPKLLYAYPGGLYFNYEISKAYYFPGSGYLLVFTHQPMLATGNDTMHGFLLFRELAVDSLGLTEADRASQALSDFFSLLHDGRYSEAVRYYGGMYYMLRDWNPTVPANDYPTLLMNGCKYNGLLCLKIKRLVYYEEVTPTVFTFTVQFMNDDGSLFVSRGEAWKESEFTYTVRRVGDRFLVDGLPPYQQ